MGGIRRIGRLALDALRDTLLMFVIYMPGPSGMILRRVYYRKKLKAMGENVRIEPGVFFQHPECISMGRNCWIQTGVILQAGRPAAREDRRVIKGRNSNFEGEIILGEGVQLAAFCTVSGMGGLKIGKNTRIGTKASIYTYSHVSVNILFSNGMVIGKDVGIGAHSVLIGVSEIPDEGILKPNTFLSEVFFKKAGL